MTVQVLAALARAGCRRKDITSKNLLPYAHDLHSLSYYHNLASGIASRTELVHAPGLAMTSRLFYDLFKTDQAVVSAEVLDETTVSTCFRAQLYCFVSYRIRIVLSTSFRLIGCAMQCTA